MVEFFRRRASVGFKENSLEVNTHLMAFLRGMCLFMKFFSDTTISYEVVRGTPILLNTAGVRRKGRSSTGGTFVISWTLF